MSATLSVLNVGHGDLKVSFDNQSESEKIRAARIIKDMLRRGYALLVEVERDGVKAYERALAFDEARSEYIIADLDTEQAERVDKEEANGKSESDKTGSADVRSKTGGQPRKLSRRTKGLAMGTTNAVGVARSAGG